MRLDYHAPPQNPYRRQSRRRLSSEVAATFKALCVVLTLLGLGSTFAFLYTNSDSSAKGYTLQELELAHQNLAAKERSLEHQVINAISLETIGENLNDSDMENIKADELIFIGDQNVAYRGERQSQP